MIGKTKFENQMNNLGKIVVKFGGTPNSSADNIRIMIDIIIADKWCKYIVVSAPGEQDEKNDRVTTLLKYVALAIENKESWVAKWNVVERRFFKIIFDLGIESEMGNLLREIKVSIEANPYYDFIVSRGEFIQAQIVACYLSLKGYKARFVDSAECIFFGEDGEVDEEVTRDAVLEKVNSEDDECIFIFSGFYGTAFDGKIKILGFGGSDLTGAIIANALQVFLYQNWTNVDGFFTADPKVVVGARPIVQMNYNEASIMASAGANVLHEDTVLYLQKNAITICIKNIYNPQGVGTKIFPEHTTLPKGIVGVVGELDFTIITIRKIDAHKLVGFGATILKTFSDLGISYSYELSGGRNESSFAIRHLSAVNQDFLIKALLSTIDANEVSVINEVGIINSISYNPQDYSDILLVLERNGFRRFTSAYIIGGQIIITLPNDDLSDGVQAIHDRFFH